MNLNPNSSVAVLGGAGKAGRYLVQELLSAGYHPRLLLRHPEKFNLSHAQLEILQGDARDPDALQTLLNGCIALISTLGHPKGETTPIIGSVTQRLITALNNASINRYIVVSSLLYTGTEQLDGYTQQAAAYMDQHFPANMADRRAEFQSLVASELDWTYVRVPYIVQEPSRGNIAIDLNHLPGQQISATDLGRFLASQLTDPQYIRKAIFVANS